MSETGHSVAAVIYLRMLVCRRESASSQHENSLELNPFNCGAVLSAVRKAGIKHNVLYYVYYNTLHTK